ncbi:MAG TPA: ComEC/Rec2 family competence protein [Candidatus Paceibacterota bacterium]|nr:ComEC/Rec2 family competence protein [Candidatus Paceibacterota bacterium]
MERSGLVLLACVLGFGSGTLCRSFFTLGASFILFVLLLCAICFIAWLTQKRIAYLIGSLFLVALALGVGRVALISQDSRLLERIGEEITLTGKIVEIPDVRETAQRLTLATQEGKVLAVAPLFPRAQYGETIDVRGVIARPEPFDANGGRIFRYDQFLAKDGIFVLVNDAQIIRVSGRSTFHDFALGALSDVRAMFMSGLERALPEPHASLASGMLVGGKQGLGRDLLDVFTVAGLVHIVVLSGYNIMIIAEAVMRSSSFLHRRLALAISSLIIAAFVLAAGAGAAAVRAGIMALVALFARATGRTYDALRALGVAVILMLLYNPLLLAFDPGFQLSALATLGLIVGAPLIERRIPCIQSATLREVLATTIAAQIAVLPLLLYQTGNLSIVTLPANVLILPFVPLAMLLSFVAACMALLIPVFGPYAGLPAYVLLSYVIGIAEFLAAAPFASVLLPAFPFLFVLVAYVGIGLIVRNEMKKQPHLRAAASRIKS